ncbi:hypothetical protein SS50377_20767 [Spironucleus salmonicida]|uniref:Uncharacterized protein n=1 Tax=Spironucleus salmonicida TaxID=348837 RepID=V6M1P1_9EUKA|nr:hypothetical protein SS50377_20767 [Spironucleus salmonicida]|eukprot:EST47124.1 Hypothetical protein SS50377_12833 [Spironucleus salmonicida]
MELGNIEQSIFKGVSFTMVYIGIYYIYYSKLFNLQNDPVKTNYRTSRTSAVHVSAVDLQLYRRRFQLFEPADRADVVHQELNPPWIEAAAQDRKNAPLRDYFGGQRPDPGQQLPAAPDGGAQRVLNVVADGRQRRPVSRGSVGKVSLNSLVQPVLDRLGLSGALVVFDVLAVVEELERGVAADILDLRVANLPNMASTLSCIQILQCNID